MRRKNKCVAYKKAYKNRTVCLNAIERAYRERGVMLKYYECPVCLDFHLTSKNVDKSEFFEFDKAIITKQWATFEILFNTVHNQLYGLGKVARKNRRKKENRRKREQEGSKSSRDTQLDKVTAKRLQKQISLADQRRLIAELRLKNNKIDRLNNLWIKLNQWFKRSIIVCVGVSLCGIY